VGMITNHGYLENPPSGVCAKALCKPSMKSMCWICMAIV
jgi:hypothetical protein